MSLSRSQPLSATNVDIWMMILRHVFDLSHFDPGDPENTRAIAWLSGRPLNILFCIKYACSTYWLDSANRKKHPHVENLTLPHRREIFSHNDIDYQIRRRNRTSIHTFPHPAPRLVIISPTSQPIASTSCLPFITSFPSASSSFISPQNSSGSKISSSPLRLSWHSISNFSPQPGGSETAPEKQVSRFKLRPDIPFDMMGAYSLLDVHATMIWRAMIAGSGMWGVGFKTWSVNNQLMRAFTCASWRLNVREFSNIGWGIELWMSLRRGILPPLQ